MEVFGLLSTLQPAGLVQVLTNLSIIQLGLIIGAMSIPSKSLSAHTFRLALFSLLFPKIIDFATNRSQTLGHAAIDWNFAFLAWHLIARLVDVSLVPLVSPTAPRWIQPTAQELQRLQKLRTDGPKAADADQEDVYAQMPKEWETLPYPLLFSWARVLYAIDFLTLVRPGTSYILPWQFRAFEWSLPAFKSPAANRFGRAESSAKVAVAHSLLFSFSIFYCHRLINGSPDSIRTINQFSLINQLVLTISIGCMIALSSAPLEVLTFNLLIRKRILPISSLSPNFNQPYLSESIEDFWGRRWHRLVRRHLTRIGSIFPFGRTKSGNVFWAYVMSGVMHSFIFARAHPKPSFSNLRSYVPIFLDPGTTLFFTLQGVAMLIERTIIPPKFKRWWLWFSIIGSGRWYVDSILQMRWQ